MCDLEGSHHGELLHEYLTSGNLRVGEELPHWFVNGNLRGAIKCWMATRPAAVALAEGRGGAAGAAGQVETLAASVATHGSVGAAAAPLVDPLLAAMPAWRAGPTAEMSGWEAAGEATAEDVALLHCFGALVYSLRLDVTEFLQQLCGADPFSWAAAQFAQGVISEPDPWLLERYFMSRHVVGEPLPLWFATWLVRDEIRQWLQGPKASALVDQLLDARGLRGALDGEALLSFPSGSSVSPSSSADFDATLDILEAKAARLLASCVPCGNAGGAVRCRRAAELPYTAAAGSGPLLSHAADLVVHRDSDGAAMVAAVAQVAAGQSAADVAAAVRLAKERLDWLAFLVREKGGAASSLVVARVLVLAGEAAPLGASLERYLSVSGVRRVSLAELVRL